MSEIQTNEESFQEAKRAKRVTVRGPNGEPPKTFLDESAISTKVVLSILTATIIITASFMSMWADIRRRTSDRWSGRNAMEAEHLRERLNEDIQYIAITAEQMDQIRHRNED